MAPTWSKFAGDGPRTLMNSEVEGGEDALWWWLATLEVGSDVTRPLWQTEVRTQAEGRVVESEARSS